MEKLVEELSVDDGSQRIRLVGEPPFEPVAEHGRRFRFELCRKQAMMGETPVDHFWMDLGSLYGQRGRRAVNQQAIVDCWWAMCMGKATVFHEEVQESYILAKILPEARSNGSRKVFLDSLPMPRGNRKAIQQSIAELEELLAASCQQEMRIIEFKIRTGDLLGPPSFSKEIETRYETFVAELLGKGCEALQRDGTAGLAGTLDLWRRRMRTIGRRAGNELDKQVLDMLSYECRTALHRCYSAVWYELIPQLARKYAWTKESIRFHSFWHLDQQGESEQPELGDFHLFHGHLLGLHPACSRFVQTRTGSALIGRWLREPDSEESIHRLLHGIYVACDHYANENDIRALLRKGEGRISTVSDMAALEEQQWENRSGRRRNRDR